jgi:FdhE protein
MTTVHKLLTPEEIATRAGSQTPFLRLPGRNEVFAARAQRLRALAPGHAMEGYLLFIAQLADEQQAALDDMPPVSLPDARTLTLAHEHGMPPIDHRMHPRDRAWNDMLRRMVRRIAEGSEGRVAEVARRLEGSRDELYEAQASKLLAGITFGLDAATAPLIGAGLQVYFTHLALTLGEKEFPPIEATNVCPCCGSRPTASIVRIGGEPSGFRFLHCSLCSTQWHMVRVKCAHCDSTKGISYSRIETPGVQRAVMEAETCDECNHYLKIGFMDRDPNVDPCADDLATLPLDILVGDEGRQPWGVNLMLIHGDPEPPAEKAG